MKKISHELSLDDEFYFQWHLTERCNHTCRHCYQDGKPTPELELNDLFRIVERMEDAVRKWGIQGTLSLTGGEPFLRRNDLHALMDRIDISDVLAYYDILTNGSLINEAEAQLLTAHTKLSTGLFGRCNRTDKRCYPWPRKLRIHIECDSSSSKSRN